MNRRRLLLEIQKHLKVKKISSGYLEFLLEPSDSAELRRRTVFVVGVSEGESTDIQNKFSTAVGDEFKVEIYYSPNVEDIINSALIKAEDNSIENNWRGRILKRDQINKAPEHLKELLLTSTWRMMIQFGREGEYFGRHDIVPALWDPGYSIPGTKDFKRCISQTLEYLSSRTNRTLDMKYDLLECFGLKDPQKNFSRVTDTPFPIVDVVGQKQHAVRKQIEESYERFFTV